MSASCAQQSELVAMYTHEMKGKKHSQYFTMTNDELVKLYRIFLKGSHHCWQISPQLKKKVAHVITVTLCLRFAGEGKKHFQQKQYNVYLVNAPPPQ